MYQLRVHRRPSHPTPSKTLTAKYNVSSTPPTPGISTNEPYSKRLSPTSELTHNEGSDGTPVSTQIINRYPACHAEAQLGKVGSIVLAFKVIILNGAFMVFFTNLVSTLRQDIVMFRCLYPEWRDSPTRQDRISPASITRAATEETTMPTFPSSSSPHTFKILSHD